MCLENFIEYKQIDESDPIIGYRTWRNLFNSIDLKSEHREYTWDSIEGPHEITENNSGIYSYNHNYYYYDNYYYNYYYNNYHNNNNYDYDYHNNNNYDYDYDYYLQGIINQWGKTAIHKTGYRSEFAKIDTLFSIKESDARGSKEFIEWIGKFNEKIEKIAEKYECKVITWQDFNDSMNSK